ncbi:MFS transporter [Escherichia coli]|uniref:MFS transporter n=1 Tax=Escherichia coli TaxID=562 RepID=UPI0003082CC3|nr:MFS transporter [Escherichia coli]
MILDTVDVKKKGVHTRYLILLIIFIVTAVNYADRATLSIAGTEVAKELQLSAVSMGYIFSAFGWAYLLMQIPGGWLLDKFGSKKVYTYSLFFWSLFTFLQGFVDMFPLAWAGISTLYAGVLGSAIIPGERPYCRRLVPNERTWYCLRHL